MKSIVAALMLVASLLLGGCGYNTIQTQDEAVKASWSEVVNQYQRRADLIPNLVNTVKGFAAQEEKVLVGVTEARARATSIQVTPELLNNPQALQKFQAAQGDLTTALKSLVEHVCSAFVQYRVAPLGERLVAKAILEEILRAYLAELA